MANFCLHPLRLPGKTDFLQGKRLGGLQTCCGCGGEKLAAANRSQTTAVQTIAYHCSKSWFGLLTLRLLMSYIYGAPILDVSRSHTTTHHSR